MTMLLTRLRPRSLRARTILYIGAGSMLVAVVFAVATYLLARSFLLDQRVQGVQRRAAIDARLMTSRLETPGTDVPDVLAAIDPLSSSALLIHRGGGWFSSSLDVGSDSVPAALLGMAQSGRPGYQVVDGPNGEIVVVGLPLHDVGGELFEVATLDDLVRTLSILGLILTVGTVIATAAGVAIGVWSSRRVLEPLDGVATAAAQIAGGQLSRRLEPTDDPDLVTIVGSFNSMVDALQTRIERDAAFAADVSHELRTPLTTLVAAVDVLQSRADTMTPVQRQALDLTAAELERFRRLLDELIQLARFDAGLPGEERQPVDVREMVEQSLARRGLPGDLVCGDVVSGDVDAFVSADRTRLERAFANLVDNAQAYGGGVVSVELATDDDGLRVHVDDAGPGIPLADRERVFARFATSGGGRGSARGTGLGLAIVRETAVSLGGEVWCTDRPGGGARFVLRLPLTTAPRRAEAAT
jgi:two-component system, OmpR family, sensor histidine kinase MtrB